MITLTPELTPETIIVSGLADAAIRVQQKYEVLPIQVTSGTNFKGDKVAIVLTIDKYYGQNIGSHSKVLTPEEFASLDEVSLGAMVEDAIAEMEFRKHADVKLEIDK